MCVCVGGDFRINYEAIYIGGLLCHVSSESAVCIEAGVLIIIVLYSSYSLTYYSEGVVVEEIV